MNVDIKKLQINPFHANIYQTNDIADLAESINEVGQLEPIVVNKQYIIISGVRRFLAITLLNKKEAEVVIKDVNKKDELLTLVSYNKQRVKTTREMVNEVEYLKSIWGKKRGRKSIQVVTTSDSSVKKPDTREKISDATGLSTGNISKIEYINREMTELIEEIDKGNITVNQAHRDLKKAERERIAIQVSDILPTTIKHSDYTIYNKSSDDLSDLESESINIVFTSPPYFNKRTYSENSDELGSEKTPEEFVDRLANHLHQCYRVLQSDGSFFLNMADSFHNKCAQLIPHRVAMKLIDKGFTLRNTIIWKKSNPLPSSVKDNLTPSHEYIFHFVKSNKYLYNQILIPKKNPNKLVTNICQKGKNNGSFVSNSAVINILNKGKNIEDFWTHDIVTTATANQTAVKRYGGTDHPAPFPSEIVSLPILQCSNPGDIVMDPFSGSGTVGEVALLLGRKYVGYEMNSNFNKVQTSRLDDAIKKYNSASSCETKQAA